MEPEAVAEQSPVEKSPIVSKKFLIIGLAGFAVIIVFIIITIFTSNSSNKQVVSPNTIKQTSGKSNKINTDNPPQNSSPSTSPSAVANWKVYQNSLYSLKYPQEWKEVENYPDGTYLVLQPNIFKSGESGHVAVEINDANRVSVASMSAGFTSLGFKNDTILVSGVQAQKFSGRIILPGKIIYDNAYIFGHNGKVYFIKLSYIKPTVDRDLEKEFSDVVKTLILL